MIWVRRSPEIFRHLKRRIKTERLRIKGGAADGYTSGTGPCRMEGIILRDGNDGDTGGEAL